MSGPSYGASVAMTVTALHSLASDSSYLAGWFSGYKSNLTDLRLDYHVAGSFTTGASNRQAGYIYVFAVASLDDAPTWPAVSSGVVGTQGTGAFGDTEEKDCYVKPIASILADGSASAIYTFPQTSIAGAFGLIMPPTHWGIFVTQNVSSSGAGLAAAGSFINYIPIISP